MLLRFRRVGSYWQCVETCDIYWGKFRKCPLPDFFAVLDVMSNCFAPLRSQHPNLGRIFWRVTATTVQGIHLDGVQADLAGSQVPESQPPSRRSPAPGTPSTTLSAHPGLQIRDKCLCDQGGVRGLRPGARGRMFPRCPTTRSPRTLMPGDHP